MRAGEEGTEVLRADSDHDRQADGAPQRIAAADPIPKTEDTVGCDAEFRDLVERGRDGGEMLSRGGLAERGLDPFPRGFGVGHGLDGGESLGGDDEERGLRIKPLQRVVDMRAVDIGDVVGTRAVMPWRKRQRRHGRTEVRAADADVDDVADLPAGRANRLAGPHSVGEGGHGVEHVMHLGDDVLAVEQQLRAARCAQGGVEHRPVLGEVDPFAGKHGVAALLQACGEGEFRQEAHRLLVDGAFRPVEQQAVVFDGETLEPLRVGCKSSAHVLRCTRVMIAQRRKLRRERRSCHCRTP